MKCYKNHAGEFVEVCSRRLQPNKTRGRTHLSAALPQQHLPANSGQYHMTSSNSVWRYPVFPWIVGKCDFLPDPEILGQHFHFLKGQFSYFFHFWPVGQWLWPVGQWPFLVVSCLLLSLGDKLPNSPRASDYWLCKTLDPSIEVICTMQI